MKNFKKLLTIFATSALLFISCGNSKFDANGCYIDIDEAVKAAEKNNQDIMVIATFEGNDNASEDFLNKVVRVPEFKKDIASKYAVVCMDFSQATYEATKAAEDASAAEKKAAAKRAELLDKNSRYVEKLNLKQTPIVYILSKEPYMINGLLYVDEDRSYEGFKAILDEKSSVITEMHNMIYQTKIGTPEEKVAAIDALYEATSPSYRYLLLDLMESVKKLDSANKTGLLGKYIYAAADSKANLAVLNGDVKGAVQFYIEIENDERIPAEVRQQALYTAAYMCSASGAEEPSVVIGYLERAIKIAPESSDVPAIRRVIQALSAKAE